ncbi:MAG TPA: hypothetical protein PKD96_00715 [Candidatus Absconditabacterales bacterium]|nr:hypothetical protein [Candidatus Absconditabacterales bacterium]HMT26802.1 hypothetical protein [Candidatus Absconditabacterales bacterium]
MNIVLTTTLSQPIYQFLNEQATTKKTTKKNILEEALRLYQKQQLEIQIKEGFKDRKKEYQQIAKEGRNAQFKSFRE